MSAAKQAVRTIRNAALDQSNSLREQPASPSEPSPSGRDEVRRSESVSESSERLITPLTARQMHAINLLSMGKTVVATARSLDIGVSTLHRWKATHPLFKSELAQRQQNLFDAMIQKLRLTMSKAVDQLFEMMTGDSKLDRKEVMREMLRLLRPQKFLVPNEPTTVPAVLDEQVRADRASRGDVVGSEITEEERVAAIPEEWRVEENPNDASTPVRHTKRSQASGGEVQPPTQSASDQAQAPAPRGQILRCAQDDGVGDDCSAERSEATGAPERQVAGSFPRSRAGQVPRGHAQEDGAGLIRPAEASGE